MDDCKAVPLDGDESVVEVDVVVVWRRTVVVWSPVLTANVTDIDTRSDGFPTTVHSRASVRRTSPSTQYSLSLYLSLN